MNSLSFTRYLDRLQVSNVAGRLFLFFLAAQTGLMAHDDATMVGRIFDGAEYIGVAVIVVAIIGIIDTGINDILPTEFTFPFALSIRHLLLMLCASFFAIGAFLATSMPITYISLPYFVACCLANCAHAFFDVRRRFKGQK